MTEINSRNGVDSAKTKVSVPCWLFGLAHRSCLKWRFDPEYATAFPTWVFPSITIVFRLSI